MNYRDEEWEEEQREIREYLSKLERNETEDVENIHYKETGKIKRHGDICKELHDTYIKKNNDYGDSVAQTYSKYGMVSFLVRMEDKINRLKSLTVDNRNREIQKETVYDTLLDLANYAMLAAIEAYPINDGED